ncbi:group 1 truncated hemoglobin [Thalassospiraceae bacterium LMO-JJ14]|nr:group 1 truncated hemoglobin [Thalassospiraceae bacterium LMO-JJ14]
MLPTTELGDEAVLEELSELLRKRLEADPLLAPMFKDVDMDVLSRKHHLFFTMLFLGNTEIGAEKLFEAHHRLKNHGGISDEHFAAFVSHILAACRELNISKDSIARVMKSLNDVKPSIIP